MSGNRFGNVSSGKDFSGLFSCGFFSAICAVRLSANAATTAIGGVHALLPMSTTSKLSGVGSGVGGTGSSSIYQRPNQINATSSDAAGNARSVHFNTVHNCQQLATDDAAPRRCQLPTLVDEAAPPSTSDAASATAHSLPASYRCRSDGVPVDHPLRPVTPQPSTPTATINRHYAAVQPRTLYRPAPDSAPSGPTAFCRGDPPRCVGNGPLAVSPQCTVSDNGCVSPAPTSRLRHYCV